jgi:hypothetical protein
MKMNKTLLSVLVAAGMAAGCSSTTPGSSGTTLGVITGFGSVFVNGVEYETAGTQIDVEGVGGSESDLAVGQVVELNGSVNADGVTGVASSISFADNVEGLVIGATIATDGTGTLDVMGQSVTVTADTMFETDVPTIAGMSAIVAGNIVEISGYTQGDGNIVATYVKVKAASFSGGEMEVKGLVSNLDAAAMTFNIGNLLVDYGSATMDLGSATLANGLYVEVKTVSSVSGNTMTASKVEIEGDGDIEVDLPEGEDIKINGLITEVGADYIIVNGQKVYFLSNVESGDGLSLASLSTGMMIQIEAYVDADGRLIAMEMESEHEDDFSISAHVDAVDSANHTVTVLGQTIAVNTSTMLKDEVDLNPVRYFNLDDLTAGDWIKIKFYRDSAQNLVATYLERDDDQSSVAGEFELEGLVEQTGASSFTIGGIEVNNTYYPGVTANIQLQVKGSFVNGAFTINSVSLDS